MTTSHALLRVLLVDDEPKVRAAAFNALDGSALRLPEAEGEVTIAVETAASGEEALAKSARSAPDIVLLDQELPGMSGLEVLQRLGAGRRGILTVVTGAHAPLETAAAATRGGAFDFLSKPFTPEELRATVFKAGQHLALQRSAQARAQEKKSIRFELTAMLGHELKAPLAAVEGYLMAMQDRSLGPSLESYAPMLERSLARLEGMRKLIDDLLDMTRLESGQRKRELERVDVREIAAGSLETVRADAARRGIALELHAAGPAAIVADRSEMELVLNNLVTNAVKYNRDGGRVDVFVEARPGGGVLLQVRDTGIGLTSDEVGRLFKEFARIKSAKTRGIAGSGLGLSTVKKIAQLYEGDVRVTSVPDRGSTFEVDLRSA